jgi:hypothetical protein
MTPDTPSTCDIEDETGEQDDENIYFCKTHQTYIRPADAGCPGATRETPDTPSTEALSIEPQPGDYVEGDDGAMFRVTDTPSTEALTRYSLEPYATDALQPDPDGEWVRYAERAVRQEAADPSGLRQALDLVDKVIFDLPIGVDVTYSRGYSAGVAAARESLREALRAVLKEATERPLSHPVFRDCECANWEEHNQAIQKPLQGRG